MKDNHSLQINLNELKEKLYLVNLLPKHVVMNSFLTEVKKKLEKHF